ncbi:peroxide stress protein YaaA [Luminiphilus syltensis]|uniref:peroxide stress protein YaaA n=1 Tax=Luminiphilus syltensis TaxID=1341119 RepID=UPI000317E6CD|nr:peroxide stress protein YaaA [Luminiphilus syltensis]
MLTLLSPAKTLDFETTPTTRRKTLPQFLDQAEQLVEDARALDPAQIRELMGVSESIASLNHERFMNWNREFSLDNAKQAVLAFRGDVYSGLEAETLSKEELAFAQKHLRILSGLYGLLRPLDLMQPYRLEMGLRFANRGGKNLYEFWGDDITRLINKQLRGSGSDVLVNLASNEYFKAIKTKQVNADIITPVFKDKKGDNYKIISFYAKKARGLMARHIIREGINEPGALSSFSSEGYRYSAQGSTPESPVFLRDAAP